MKKPNDIKKPNPKTPSLGRLYRNLERFIHITRSFHRVETTDEKTGVVTVSYEPDQDRPQQYRPNNNPDNRPQPVEIAQF